MNLTHPKRLIDGKNYLEGPKSFGTIEGQGITDVYLQLNNKLYKMHSFE